MLLEIGRARSILSPELQAMETRLRLQPNPSDEASLVPCLGRNWIDTSLMICLPSYPSTASEVDPVSSTVVSY